MRPIASAVLVAIAIAVVMLVLGIGGIFIVPLLGVLALIAIGIWLAERKARHKPPLE